MRDIAKNTALNLPDETFSPERLETEKEVMLDESTALKADGPSESMPVDDTNGSGRKGG